MDLDKTKSPKEALESLWKYPGRRYFIAYMKPEVLKEAVRVFVEERFPWDPDRLGVEKYYKSGKWEEAKWYEMEGSNE